MNLGSVPSVRETGMTSERGTVSNALPTLPFGLHSGHPPSDAFCRRSLPNFDEPRLSSTASNFPKRRGRCPGDDNNDDAGIAACDSCHEAVRLLTVAEVSKCTQKSIASRIKLQNCGEKAGGRCHILLFRISLSSTTACAGMILQLNAELPGNA